MTLHKYCTNYLYEHMLMPNDASAVWQLLCAQDSDIASRGEDHISGYSVPFMAILRKSLNVAAIEWIDANYPKAFYRAMFE